ncbi:MAG: NAD(P)H-hydrate dehydratase [Thermosynechococcaceae cyanobacterium]
MQINDLRQRQIQMPVVTAQEMREIESRIFAHGMPIAALMEKVGGLIASRIQTLFARNTAPHVGVLVGPGHNGGDALVVARELHFRGYQVSAYLTFARLKPLTADHAQFARSLGIPFCERVEALQSCDVLLDGLFGFGLERSLMGDIAQVVETVNQWPQPIISIDLPSGIHTDTGAVLGTAIRATRTLCLGLWKLGLLQDPVQEWSGAIELIDFDISWSDIEAVLGNPIPVQHLVAPWVLQQLPLTRSPTTHKYRQGHVLLMGGSQQYVGSMMLAGLGARASGVGMLTVAVPARLKPSVSARLPDAVVIGCPETAQGAIARWPDELAAERFDAIAYGPGATTESATVLEKLLDCDRPLVLDADGLNVLARLGPDRLQSRSALTVLTPHAGEFRRLFPQWADGSPMVAAQQAAQASQAVLVRKGAFTTIADPSGRVWINTASTPALARGGSGDVLTGLMGGLLAQGLRQGSSWESAVQGAVVWHGQAGCWASQRYSVMGVNAEVLAESLIPALMAQGLASDFKG